MKCVEESKWKSPTKHKSWNCFNTKKVKNYEWAFFFYLLHLHSSNGTEDELQKKYDFLNRERERGDKIGRKQSNMPFNSTLHIFDWIAFRKVQAISFHDIFCASLLFPLVYSFLTHLTSYHSIQFSFFSHTTIRKVH